jgi:methylase of polypeptide subunit release factors
MRNGAIITAIANECTELEKMCAIEINPEMAVELACKFDNNRGAKPINVFVTCGDFLQHTEKYDRIVMNPPFTADQDIDHVLHAYDLLNPGGRLVSVMSPGWQTKTNGKCRRFRDFYMHLMNEKSLAMEPEVVPPGTFKESGTTIGTVIVVMMKPKEK